MIALPKAGSPVTHRLRVNRNGWVVLETREPGRITSAGARDLSYHLEYKSAAQSWVKLHGSYDSDRGAREALKAANNRLIWRLVASNQFGSVVLPRKWKGPVR